MTADEIRDLLDAGQRYSENQLATALSVSVRNLPIDALHEAGWVVVYALVSGRYRLFWEYGTAGCQIVDAYIAKFCEGVPEILRNKYAARADAFLAKSYDKINLGRTAGPGIMYKIGAASGLMPYLKPTLKVVKASDK